MNKNPTKSSDRRAFMANNLLNLIQLRDQMIAFGISWGEVDNELWKKNDKIVASMNEMIAYIKERLER